MQQTTPGHELHSASQTGTPILNSSRNCGRNFAGGPGAPLQIKRPHQVSLLGNNLTAKVGGTGLGWRLIQDHQHSIVWGARPPKWCLFPPITPPSSPITLSAWLFITMPIPSSGVVCVCACISPHENYAVQLGLCACVLAFVRTKIMQCNCTHARVATLN